MTPSSRYLSLIVQGLEDSTPFTGPEAIERAQRRAFKARLGANENGFGPSPHAITAMQQAAVENWKYGDPDNAELIQAIAHHHKVPAENIVIGEGIDGLLGLALKAIIDPGDMVVTSNGTYPTFNGHVACHAGRLSMVNYRDDKEDLQALSDQAKRQQAKVVYVTNPDNPMGSTWSADDLKSFTQTLPSHTVLFLDEAYCELAPPGTVPPLDPQNPRVLRFRTFSKAYALAGARVGYVIAHKILVKAINKVRNQYGINRVGQIGALAALKDQTYLSNVTAKIIDARERLAHIALENDLQPLVSGANFVTMDCRQDGAFAKRVLSELLKRDVFIRMPTVAPLDRCIRVSTGPKQDLDIFQEALPEALKAARK